MYQAKFYCPWHSCKIIMQKNSVNYSTLWVRRAEVCPLNYFNRIVLKTVSSNSKSGVCERNPIYAVIWLHSSMGFVILSCMCHVPTATWASVQKGVCFFKSVFWDKYLERAYFEPNGLSLFWCYFLFFISITVGRMEITVCKGSQ